VAYDFPVFVTFRLWDVEQATDSEEQSEADQDRQRRADDTERFKRELEAAEEERKRLRKARMQERIDELRLEWMRENVPNPNDPWDYRNFTSRDWWQRAHARPADLDFLGRFADVPGELEFLRLRNGRSARKNAKALKRETGGGELYAPHTTRQGFIGWAPIRRFVRRVWRENRREIAEEIGEEAVTRIAELVEDEEVQYSPRQLWPAAWFDNSEPG
jgi:hypothetical protein